MEIFKKNFTTSEAKVLQDNNGSFEGVFNEMFYVDDGGDIVIGVSELDKFTKDGFAPDTHGMNNGAGGNYTYKDLLGFPTFAEVRGYSIYGGFAFHTDEDSQKVRAKMQDRLSAGKSVSLSIGYYLTEPPIYVDAKNYSTEFPKFIPKDRLQSCYDRAKMFPRVRLIKVGLYEVSPVPIPMNDMSLVTAVKMHDDGSMDVDEIAEYLGDSALETISVSALDTFYYRLWSIIWEQIKYTSSPKADKIAKIETALNKFVQTYLFVLNQLLPEEGDDPEGEKLAVIEEEVKSIFGETTEEFYQKRIGRTYNAQIASCISAMKHIVNRGETIAEKRGEEIKTGSRMGSIFTNKNEEGLVKLRDEAMALPAKLEKFIGEKHTEPTKSDDADADLLLESESILLLTQE